MAQGPLPANDGWVTDLAGLLDRRSRNKRSRP